MAFTKTDIGNMALSHLGEGRINEFGEQTEEGREVSLWFDLCRQETLEASNWNFARTRMTLATHAEAPPQGVWAFRFRYPNNCLKVRWLQHPFSRQSKRIPFQVELAPTALDKSILTDIQEAVAIFTVNLTNISLFSAMAVGAMSHLMAARMAKALNGTEKDQRVQYQLFQAMVSMAKASNANEQAEYPPEDADVILARSGGTDFSPASQTNIWEVPGNTGG